MRKFFAVTALIVSSQLQAQEDTTTGKMDEVTITATKMPLKQSQTGKVVTVINKEQIERSVGKTLGRLLNEQAGVTINGTLNNLGTNQTVYMRGASSGRTLVLLDGVPVYDPSFIGNEFDLNLISLNEVERIEVCRGAQSTLYGSDAVAGVINIITTKTGVTKPFNLKTTLSGGNYNTFRGNAQVFGQTGKLHYTARYAKLYSGGFSAAEDTTKTKNYDRDAYNGDLYSVALRYNLTPALMIRAFAQDSRYTTELDAGIFADEKDYSIGNRNWIAGASLHYTKGIVQLTANYQFSDTKRNYVNDSSFVPANSFSKYVTDDYFGKTNFAEAYASIDLGGGFRVLQGADYRFANMNSQYYSLSPGAPGPFNPFRSFTKDSVQSQASVYASLFYTTLKSKLNLELGGRLNVHSRYGSNQTYTFNPSYVFTKNWRVFGSVATGFKAPTLFQLYSSSGNLNLQPEVSKTYEAGFQQTGTKVQTRVVYFHRDIENAIDYNNLLFRYFNINRQKVNGIEVEASVQPVTGFTLTANYTYLNPEERSQSRVTFKDTTYQNLLRRPAHHLNVLAGYAFTNGLYVNIGGKYVSSRYDVGGYKRQDVLLDGYILLNAYAEYSFRNKLKIFADAQNLTNKKFVEVRGYNSIPFIFSSGVTFTL